MLSQFSLLGGDEEPTDPGRPSLGRKPKGEGKFYRLFFAIVPEIQYAMDISRRSDVLDQEHGVGGKQLAAKRLHITLHIWDEFKELPEAEVMAAIRAGNAVQARAFDIVFDRAMTFRAKNNPYVLRVGEGLRQIDALWLQLGIEIANQRPFVRKPFTPHMTLSYHGRLMEEHAIDPIRWTANKMVLINSHYGDTEHEVMASWSLPA